MENRRNIFFFLSLQSKKECKLFFLDTIILYFLLYKKDTKHLELLTKVETPTVH